MLLSPGVSITDGIQAAAPGSCRVLGTLPLCGPSHDTAPSLRVRGLDEAQGQEMQRERAQAPQGSRPSQ